MEKVNEFKEFVRLHPGLKEEVSSGSSTWQSIYEAWYLYGSIDAQWNQFKEVREKEKVVEEKSEEQTKSDLFAPEMMVQAFEYLQKVDIDKVQKTMGTFQQFIQIFQTMQSGKGGAGKAAAGMLGASAIPKQNYSGFFSQFDD